MREIAHSASGVSRISPARHTACGLTAGSAI